MQVTLCDWCHPKDTPATFRVSFARIMPPGPPNLGGMVAESDKPIDLCKKHYDEMWCGHGPR